MKILRLILPFLALALLPLSSEAQSPQLIYNGQFSGTANQVLSGATMTFNSGSVVNFQNGTLAANRLMVETNTSGTLGSIGLGAGLSVSGGNLVAGSSSSANPTAKVGPSVVNGSATTFMTSDSAPPINLASAYAWTGLHTFAYPAVATSGSEYGIEIIPTLNQRNAANFSLIFGNETVTQAGTGNQYLLQLQVGAANKWVVDSTGTVLVGGWNAGVIPAASGGAGTINGPLSGNGSGVVTLATGGTGISVTSGGIAITSLVVTNAGASLPSNSVVLGNTSPDVKTAAGITTDGTSELLLGVAGTSVGKIAFANATSGSITLAPVTGALGSVTVSLPATTGTLEIFSGSSTANDVPSFSNSTGSLQDPAIMSLASNNATISVNSSAAVPLIVTNAANASFLTAAQFLNPSLGSGNHNLIAIGVAGTSANQAQIYFNYTSSGSTSNSIGFGFNGADNLWMMNDSGSIITRQAFVPAAVSSGAAPYFKLTIPADTALTASTEAPGFQTVTGTRTWATTGTVALQREYKFAAPTYASASASQTFTTAATVDITGAPIAGTNAIITAGYALNIEGGGMNVVSGAVNLGSGSTTVGTLTSNGSITLPNNTAARWLDSGSTARRGILLTSSNTWDYGDIDNAGYGLNFFGGPGQPIQLLINESVVLSVASTGVTVTGTSTLTGKIASYNGVTTAGWGVPSIYGTNNRAVGATGATANLYTYTVGAADGTFEVDGNVLITAATTCAFTMTVTYTDEGNTSRTLTLTFSQSTGTLLTSITNVTGTGAYEGVPLHIRCKASTAITFATVGTFTSVTYNAEGLVKQEG